MPAVVAVPVMLWVLVRVTWLSELPQLEPRPASTQ